jgi:hypothetical protein
MVHVMMVLAQGPGFPEGNLDDHMNLHVKLTAQGHLDASAWETSTTTWSTARERSGHPTRTGELVKIEEGWALRSVGAEDDPLYSFIAPIIRPGEIVQISRLDGDEMLYRIVAVEPD